MSLEIRQRLTQHSWRIHGCWHRILCDRLLEFVGHWHRRCRRRLLRHASVNHALVGSVGANGITGMVGLSKGSDEIIGNAFDILSLEALFLIPR